LTNPGNDWTKTINYPGEFTMPTYLAQIRPKGSDTLDPANWQEFTADDQQAAAIAALHASGRIAQLLPCTVSVSAPLNQKLMFHDNGAPAVVYSFDFARTN
jgi:hypothetical protein